MPESPISIGDTLMGPYTRQKRSTPASGEIHKVDMLRVSNLQAYEADKNMTPENYRADANPNGGYCGRNTGAADEVQPGSGYPRGN